MKSKNRVSWQAWPIGILGLWLIVAAFVHFSSTVNLWNNLLVGLIVAVFAVTIINRRVWQSWVCLIVGIWSVVSAFIPSFRADSGHLWNDLISGLIIAVGGFSLLFYQMKMVKRANKSRTDLVIML